MVPPAVSDAAISSSSMVSTSSATQSIAVLQPVEPSASVISTAVLQSQTVSVVSQSMSPSRLVSILRSASVSESVHGAPIVRPSPHQDVATPISNQCAAEPTIIPRCNVRILILQFETLPIPNQTLVGYFVCFLIVYRI